MSHVNPFGNNEYKVFIGRLPPQVTRKQLDAAVKKWEGVVDVFYDPGKGWCTVEFTSRRRRDEFVRNKNRHNTMFGQWVDIKEYVWVPKQLKEETTAPSTRAKKAAQPQQPQPAQTVAPVAPIAPVAPWAQAEQRRPSPGVVIPSAAPDQVGRRNRQINT